MKKCRHCKSEMDKKANVCPTCKNTQKHYVLGIILGIIGLWLFISVINEMSNNTTTIPKGNLEQTQNQNTSIETKTEENSKPKISNEYKNALNKAETYSKTMHMSKSSIYDQLTSEYGEKFPADAAQYAIDNLVADWNANALNKAKTYQQTMSMSKSAIYDQLVSENGEKFTAAEANYAIQHLDN